MAPILVGPSLYHSHKPSEPQGVDDPGGAEVGATNVPR